MAILDFFSRWRKKPTPIETKEKLKFNPFGRFAEAVKISSKKFEGDLEAFSQQEIRAYLADIAVVAFIGPSGTGKSTRAIKVARDHDIAYMIDDGLLIHGSSIIAGSSAKRASSKLDAVRRALFADSTRAQTMRRALLLHSPPTLMILGTSDRMLNKICDNLWLKAARMLIRIEDVASEEERLIAKKTRMTQGKHTIPVPSMEIKHEFSGYLTAPIQKLKRKLERSSDHYGSPDHRRTVVRPTFSTLGSYLISDYALESLMRLILKEQEGVAQLISALIHKEAYGAVINLDLALYYGYSAEQTLERAQAKLFNDIEKYTAINVLELNLRACRLSKPADSDKLVLPAK